MALAALRLVRGARCIGCFSALRETAERPLFRSLGGVVCAATRTLSLRAKAASLTALRSLDRP